MIGRIAASIVVGAVVGWGVERHLRKRKEKKVIREKVSKLIADVPEITKPSR
jgi:uncharacterized oligopeptide transporter (OPT) family protein